MCEPFRRSLRLILCVVAAALLGSESGAQGPPKAPKNLGLEEGEVGKVPEGWFFPKPCQDAGYSLKVSEEKPFAGKRCALLSRKAATGVEGFGNVLQFIDAGDFRGKRVRFRAAVRAEVAGDGNQAMLWLRVDKKDGAGFFENMADRPIKTNQWNHYEIVGDIDDDAQSIVFGMLLLGNGTAALDDVSFEIVEKTKVKTTAAPQRPKPSPGLTEVVMAVTINAEEKAGVATFAYPLPLSYRDQVPLTFRLAVDPPGAAKSVEIAEGSGENRLLKLTLHDLGKHRKVNVEYRSLVLVRPTSFAGAPKAAKFPKEWPAEARPWLKSTWCVDHEHARVATIAREIRGESDDVMAVIREAIARSQKVFANAKGRVNTLTSVEALDKQGSCTSCANLVAALLRGAGIPARILSGYPLWSGPLQTHYIVEAYVPGFGWYPVESTMGRSPWPNFQQVNVSIISVEQESEAKAGPRRCAAGGVPFQSLTEFDTPALHFFAVGTLRPFCDHECRLVRPIDAADADWSEALKWAKPRWATWLKSKPQLAAGQLKFGPAAEEVKSGSLSELRASFK